MERENERVQISKAVGESACNLDCKEVNIDNKIVID